MLDIEKAYKQNFSKATKYFPNSVNNFFIAILKKLFHEKTYNEIFEKNHYLKGLEFVDSMLELLHIEYTIKPNELKNIPSTGKILVIANHITGASDAFTLVQLIASARENKKVRLMVNGMLMGVTQASDIIIPVDNITGAITKTSLKTINEALDNGEAVVIFPAGVVNRLSIHGIKDIPWKASFLKIAQKNNCPILPIKIKSRNTILFYFVSLILPKKLSGLLMLPREFAIAGKMKPLAFTIVRVIPISSFTDKNIQIAEYLKLFYTYLYALGTKKKSLLQTETTIISAQNKILLKEEVNNAEVLGHTLDGKKIILAEAKNSPFLMLELGRVREVSFRAIGGGTGGARDNDLYDNYYKHLILWDEEDLEIVGAYRIGEVAQIIKKRGIESLYTYSLCNFNEHFQDYYNNSVELGRSFVQPKYWGSRALDNLWQGVGAYLAKNPHIVYTYDTVTINADTPKQSVAALVYFYSFYFPCETHMMSAKTPYLLSNEQKKEFDMLFKDKSYKDGFMILKRYLKDLETSVPTLFKQYAELYNEGALRFFDFSINEELHGVVEGFIIADNSKMKEAKRKRYIKNL